ncbi:hypothetical protein EV714DRAFT_278175 [Schizophyllum commune]
MLTTPSRLVYHLGYYSQSAFDAAIAGSIHRLLARLPINLTVTRSLVAPLALLDATGSSLVLVRLPKPSTRSRTPLGLHSRPFAPTYDSLLALVHDGGIDAGVAVADDDEGERRARPVGAEYQFLSDRDDDQRRPRERDVEPEYQVDLWASGRFSAQRSPSPDAPPSTRMCDDYARSSMPTAA